jgi:short-subunit dehydrogenase
MKILISGNPAYGLAEALATSLAEHELSFVSRTTHKLDLTKSENQQIFADMSVDYDVVVINSALWKFNQTLLLEAVYKKLKAEGKQTRIICVGSTTDRVMKATDWLYNAEKKALRDYANSLGMTGVWATNPRVTLISFGTLSNVQAKHPDRKTMPTKQAADYIKWIIEQPAGVHINELSIDPLQT